MKINSMHISNSHRINKNITLRGVGSGNIKKLSFPVITSIPKKHVPLTTLLSTLNDLKIFVSFQG